MELFILYASERSGSTLLTDSIKNWLWPSKDILFGQRCEHTQLLRQILLNNEYRENTNRWICKFHNLGHVLESCEFLRNIDKSNSGYEMMLEKYFTKRYSVYLSRRNKVLQAVSLLKARQTEQYYFDKELKGECFFDAKELKKIIIKLVNIEYQWESLIEKLRIEPYRIYYEDVMKDITEAGYKIADHFGFERPANPYAPYLKKQADEINVQWAERFAGSGILDKII